MSEEGKKPSLSILSNKRLNEIKQALIQRGMVDVDGAIADICEIMKFNPDYAKGKYTPESGQRFMQWQRKRVAELGINQSQYRKGGAKTT